MGSIVWVRDGDAWVQRQKRSMSEIRNRGQRNWRKRHPKRPKTRLEEEYAGLTVRELMT